MSKNVDEIIHQYVSEFYDPQKAHDYYMRTRQLKGDQPQLDKEQKKIFAVSKSNIGAKRTSELKGNSQIQTARLSALRQTATATRDRITAELATFFSKTKDKKLRVNAQKEARLKRLKVAGDLKSVLASSRASYKQQVAGVKANYDKITANERLKISNVDTSGIFDG
jgi:hypothetical protein